MKKLRKNNKGFSLVELIIVIAIMAALVAILAPQYLKYVEKSRVTADENIISELENAIKVAAVDETYTITTGNYVKISNASATKTTASPNAGVAAKGLGAALTEYYGANWADVYLKSKNFDATASNGNPTTDAAYENGLYLNVTIAADGGVTVTRSAAAPTT